MLHEIEHIMEHTLIDSIKLVPFLFLTYLAMEFLEHKAGDKTSHMVRKAGGFGPLIGGVAGVVPQCGFSAAASNLYAGRVISLGTLLAIYLSTSDEMLPILISNQDKVSFSEMLGILALKAGIGIVVGFAVDAVMKYLIGGKRGRGAHSHASHKKHAQEVHHHGEHGHEGHVHAHEDHGHEGHEHAHEDHGHEGHVHAHEDHGHEGHVHAHEDHGHEGHVYAHEDHGHEGHVHTHEEHHQAHGNAEHVHTHEGHSHIHELCEHEHCNCEKDGVFLSAVKHTLKITFFIILFTFAINILLHVVGEDMLASLIMDRPVLGPVVAGIVGLVPNCASSVAITQLYVGEVIGLGTMMSGLLVNAGIGLLVLFRVNHNKMETLKITGLLYAIGVVAGIVIELIM